MSQELNYTIVNSAGKVIFTKDAMERTIHSIADYSSIIDVKKVEAKIIDEYNQLLFVITLSNKYGNNIYKDLIANFQKRLYSAINNAFDISNFVVILVFE